MDNVKGRKVNVSGSMETLDGQKLCEAQYVDWERMSTYPLANLPSALFIEPKWAQYLQSSGVTEAMGKPMAIPTASQRAAGEVERIV